MTIKVRQGEIAKACGVSVSTVSRVLNGVAGISPEVRKKVLRTAESLGMALPQKIPGRSSASSILVLAPMPILSAQAGQFHTDILAGLGEAAAAHGVKMVCLPAGDPREVAAAMEDQDGLILLSMNSGEVLSAARNRNLPIVLLNSEPTADADSFDTVLPDNYGGGAKAYACFNELVHSHLAFVSHSDRVTIRQRLAGFAANEDQAIPVLDLPLGCPAETASERLGKLLSDAGTTAFACSNDITAIAVIQALGRLGLSVPEDISVIGFDDLPQAAMFRPPLTTLQIDREALGAAAFRRLMTKIETHDEPAMRQIMATRLIVRESTAPLHRK